jgi:putative RNA 2'-phosphotransferase
MLKQIVATDEKGRYGFSADGLKIRCLQGHSSPMVDLDFEEKKPPATLFHGTVATVADSIMAQGLLPQKRHYVHLSRDLETASNVGGRRKGELVVFEVDARGLSAACRKFYQSENDVWLTDHVPAEYLRRLDI